MTSRPTTFSLDQRPRPWPIIDRPLVATGAASRLLLAKLSIIDIADCDRAPGQRTTETAGEFQRQAGFQRCIDRIEIGRADIGWDARSRIGQARRANQAASLVEAEAHRHLHAGLAFIGWR